MTTPEQKTEPAKAPPVANVTRFDYGTLGAAEPTQVGGVRVPARLARTGVLVYRNPDGTTRKELRLPEEVFHANSLKTIADAPVTVGHQPTPSGGLVDSTVWKSLTTGHARDVRQEGDRFVSATLVVQDATTVDKIDRGDLRDVSMGYTCKLDETPGVWNGEHYDAVQRNIRYNHVALLPKGRGRAGTDVGIRLDSNAAEEVVTEEEKGIEMKVIRIDGKEYEVGSDAHLSKVEEMHKAELDKAADYVKRLDEGHKADLAKIVNEKTAVQKTADETAARLDASEKECARLKTELAAAQDPKSVQALVEKRVGLLVAARSVLGDEVKLDEKGDRDVMIEVIKTDADYSDFTGEGKSLDYVTALFEAVTKRGVRNDGVASVVRTAEIVKRADASNADDPEGVEKARKASETARREAHLKPLAFSKDKAS